MKPNGTNMKKSEVWPSRKFAKIKMLELYLYTVLFESITCSHIIYSYVFPLPVDSQMTSPEMAASDLDMSYIAL